MRVLITNDDGIEAPGLLLPHAVLAESEVGFRTILGAISTEGRAPDDASR